MALQPRRQPSSPKNTLGRGVSHALSWGGSECVIDTHVVCILCLRVLKSSFLSEFLRPSPNWRMPRKRPVISCRQQQRHMVRKFYRIIRANFYQHFLSVVKHLNKQEVLERTYSLVSFKFHLLWNDSRNYKLIIRQLNDLFIWMSTSTVFICTSPIIGGVNNHPCSIPLP
jgi:hypothetical protein